MGKYESFSPPTEKKIKTVHPIWRGIGFIYMIVSPILAYFASLLILDLNRTNQWFRIPYDLRAPGTDPLLYVKIISTIVLVFVLYIIFLFITFFVYRIFGPSPYGPTDVRPKRYRGKKYTR